VLALGGAGFVGVAGTTGTAKSLGTSITFVAPGTRMGLGTSTTVGGVGGAAFSTVRSIILVSVRGGAGVEAAGTGGVLIRHSALHKIHV
jgi:hypothetical protein